MLLVVKSALRLHEASAKFLFKKWPVAARVSKKVGDGEGEERSTNTNKFAIFMLNSMAYLNTLRLFGRKQGEQENIWRANTPCPPRWQCHHWKWLGCMSVVVEIGQTGSMDKQSPYSDQRLTLLKATQMGCVYVAYSRLTHSSFYLIWDRMNHFEMCLMILSQKVHSKVLRVAIQLKYFDEKKAKWQHQCLEF